MIAVTSPEYGWGVAVGRGRGVALIAASVARKSSIIGSASVAGISSIGSVGVGSDVGVGAASVNAPAIVASSSAVLTG